MKNILISLWLLVACTSQIFAQKDAKAKTMLDNMSKTYSNASSITADFSLTIENKAASLQETQKGKVLLKGKKFRIEMADQDIFSDGTSLFTLLKDVNELQITTYKPEPDEITPINLFSLYQKGFDYYLIEEKTIGGVKTAIIDLVPTDKSKPFFKIKLQLDLSKNQLSNARVFEKSGTEYLYNISNLLTNKVVDDNKFIYTKAAYPKLEVIDLRKK